MSTFHYENFSIFASLFSFRNSRKKKELSKEKVRRDEETFYQRRLVAEREEALVIFT